MTASDYAHAHYANDGDDRLRDARIAYHNRRAILIDYLRMKVEIEDWHGVADAANDLRELDAEWRGRQK